MAIIRLAPFDLLAANALPVPYPLRVPHSTPPMTVLGLTYQRAGGDRLAMGHGALPGVAPVEVSLQAREFEGPRKPGSPGGV